ncbi:MAG: hypothetical protein C0501_14545 [Isosphaera sp.]|nr:hypothetical protein [Isosphaera sp.]
MADHLPDDPRQWPADPFRVLGVEPGVAEADIRRAYTRLIRRFKPEHAPEQFRRVREAYEQALEMTRWGGWTPPAFTVTVQSGDEPAPRPAAPADPQDAVWALAATDPAAAYSRLVELGQARPDDPGPALRLYWLLAVRPGLDPDRTRHDWLAAALTRGRLSGPAAELYRREVAADPDRALHGPYRRLTEAADASSHAVLQIAWRRLGPAAAGRAWMVVEDDLAAVAGRAGGLPERDWLSYLVAVAGHAAFEVSHPLSGRCRQLLTGLRHLELREGWAFDLLEEREAAARVWGDTLWVPPLVRDAVRLAWAGAEEWRQAVRRAAAWAAADPPETLRAFDAATRPAGNRRVLEGLARLLAGVAVDPVAYPPEVVRGLAHDFLARDTRADYDVMRPALLAFLLAERLDPEELCRACEVDPGLRPRTLAGHVRADAGLRLAWQTATAGGQ